MTNPTWAGRSATPPSAPQSDDRGGWIPFVGVVVALGLVGVGGYLLGSTGNDATEAAPLQPTTTVETVGPNEDDQAAAEALTEPPSDAAASGDEADGTTALADESTREDSEEASTPDADSDDASGDGDSVDDSVDDSGDDSSESGSTAGDSAAEDQTANQVVIEEGETRGAVLRAGVLYLGGEVPSREVADQIIERAAAVVGEENIVDEYVVNPDAAMEQGAPLYVEDVVLFAYGESTYDPQFEPLLDLGLLLLTQNPTVTVTIVTHTDASGSEIFNDQLSFARGQSVAQYWVDRGIPVEQIAIDARGERDPRADNHTDEGAQLNRRAEFYIEGLLP